MLTASIGIADRMIRNKYPSPRERFKYINKLHRHLYSALPLFLKPDTTAAIAIG